MCVRFFSHKRICPLYKFCLELRQTAKLSSIYPLYLKNELFHQSAPEVAALYEWGYSILFLTMRKSHNFSVAYFP